MIFRSHRAALAAAVVLTTAAALCWHDAYERRGRRRPWAARLAGAVL